METPVIIAAVVILGVIISILVFRNRSNFGNNSGVRARDVRLSAEDGTGLSGSYVQADGDYAVILLHMMPATKESYDELAKKLKRKGFSSIAIDLRGHGESEGGPEGYKDFSDEDHQRSIEDVYAASDFLRDKGFDLDHQFVVGASIGANLGLQFASDNEEVKAVALLSPGLNYSGIETKPLIENLVHNQAVLIAASEDDKDRAHQARELLGLAPAEAKADPIIHKDAGHGTDMFGKESPGLQAEIIKFFERSI